MNDLFVKKLMDDFGFSEGMAFSYTSLVSSNDEDDIYLLLSLDRTLTPKDIDNILYRVSGDDIYKLYSLLTNHNKTLKDFADSSGSYVFNVDEVNDFINSLDGRSLFLKDLIFDLNLKDLSSIKNLIDYSDMSDRYIDLIKRVYKNPNFKEVLIFIQDIFLHPDENVKEDQIFEIIDLILRGALEDSQDEFNIYYILRNTKNISVLYIYNNLNKIGPSLLTYLGTGTINVDSEIDFDTLIILSAYGWAHGFKFRELLDIYNKYKNNNLHIDRDFLDKFFNKYSQIYGTADILKLILDGSIKEAEVDEIINKYHPSQARFIFKVYSNNYNNISLEKFIRQYNFYNSQGLGNTVLDNPILFGINPDLFTKEHRCYYKLIGIFKNRWNEWLDKFDGSGHDAELVLPYKLDKISSVYNGLSDFLFKYQNKNHLHLRQIVSNWDKIPQELKKTQDFDEILSYLYKKSYGLDEENDFARMSFLFGLDDYKYLETKKIYDISQEVPLPSWAEIPPIQEGKYIGYFLSREDPRGLFIGNFTNCCQHIDGQAALCAVHSQVSPFGAVFVVEDNKNNILAQSWAWEGAGQVIFDNIEGDIVKGDNDDRKRVILEIYKRAAIAMKEKSELDILIGYNNEYGLKGDSLSQFPDDKKKRNFPEDYNQVRKDYCEDSSFYPTDSENTKKIANIYNKMLKICNKIDPIASDLSDRLIKVAGYYSGWAAASWLSPSGEEFDTKGETHQGWIFSNRDFIENEIGLFTEIYQEMLDDHNDYVYEEINKIKQNLSECDFNDPDEADYINKLKQDLSFYESSLDDVDFSNINTSLLVSKLIKKGWIRKLEKHGNLHYEFYGDSAIKTIEDNIFNNISNLKEYTPIVLEDLGNNRTINFELGDWLSSKGSLSDWLSDGKNQYLYNKGLGRR